VVDDALADARTLVGTEVAGEAIAPGPRPLSGPATGVLVLIGPATGPLVLIGPAIGPYELIGPAGGIPVEPGRWLGAEGASTHVVPLTVKRVIARLSSTRDRYREIRERSASEGKSMWHLSQRRRESVIGALLKVCAQFSAILRERHLVEPAEQECTSTGRRKPPPSAQIPYRPSPRCIGAVRMSSRPNLHGYAHRTR
jgi:hypothetical protein